MGRKNITLISSAVLILGIVLKFQNYCFTAYESGPNLLCLYQLGELFIMLGVFFVIFSFITKKMNDGVFLAWLRFTKWWVVPALLAVAFASSSHDAFFSYFEKRPISFFISIVYVVVSTVIFVYKSNQLRKK